MVPGLADERQAIRAGEGGPALGRGRTAAPKRLARVRVEDDDGALVAVHDRYGEAGRVRRPDGTGVGLTGQGRLAQAWAVVQDQEAAVGARDAQPQARRGARQVGDLALAVEHQVRALCRIGRRRTGRGRTGRGAHRVDAPPAGVHQAAVGQPTEGRDRQAGLRGPRRLGVARACGLGGPELAHAVDHVGKRHRCAVRRPAGRSRMPDGKDVVEGKHLGCPPWSLGRCVRMRQSGRAGPADCRRRRPPGAWAAKAPSANHSAVARGRPARGGDPDPRPRAAPGRSPARKSPTPRLSGSRAGGGPDRGRRSRASGPTGACARPTGDRSRARRRSRRAGGGRAPAQRSRGFVPIQPADPVKRAVAPRLSAPHFDLHCRLGPSRCLRERGPPVVAKPCRERLSEREIAMRNRNWNRNWKRR